MVQVGANEERLWHTNTGSWASSFDSGRASISIQAVGEYYFPRLQFMLQGSYNDPIHLGATRNDELINPHINDVQHWVFPRTAGIAFLQFLLVSNKRPVMYCDYVAQKQSSTEQY